MSDKNDSGTDRRTVIGVAAAAAGIAAAGVSQAQVLKGSSVATRPRLAPTQIRVDLGGVHLPENVAAALQSQIQRDVLGAVAKAGIKGTVRPGGLGPGIYGIIYMPQLERPG